MKQKLYLIPGLMCDSRLWSSIKNLLEDDFECIHIPIPLCSNLDEMVEHIKSILPNEPVNLLGFSLGGYIATYFATHEPNRINKLMVMSASGCDLPLAEIQKRQSMFEMSSHISIKGLSKKKILSLLDEKHHTNDAIIDCIATMYKELGQEVFKSQIQATLYRKDVLSKLVVLHIPMAFVYATNDVLVNKQWIEKLKINSSIQIIEHDSFSHMLPLEEPEFCALHIKQFFNENK